LEPGDVHLPIVAGCAALLGRGGGGKAEAQVLMSPRRRPAAGASSFTSHLGLCPPTAAWGRGDWRVEAPPIPPRGGPSVPAGGEEGGGWGFAGDVPGEGRCPFRRIKGGGIRRQTDPGGHSPKRVPGLAPHQERGKVRGQEAPLIRPCGAPSPRGRGEGRSRTPGCWPGVPRETESGDRAGVRAAGASPRAGSARCLPPAPAPRSLRRAAAGP